MWIMIYDCFTFFNEFELLEIRFHELDKWVDKFVLVESEETFTGNRKPLWFDENKHLFDRFLPKIIHLVSPIAKKVRTYWDRERKQRDYIIKGLRGCSKTDLILISDVDEIPKGMDFTKIEIQDKWMTPFIQKQYFYYMNLRRPGGWPGTVLLSFENIWEIFEGSPHKARLHRRHGKMLNKDGGWHFTFIGGAKAVQLKVRSYCHFGSKGTDILLNPETLHHRMEVERAAKGKKLELVEIDSDFPNYLIENIEKFKHLITEDTKNE
jgi:beta-1,4-mannosyl-glycoprotein beta-1,4-N-acetylglucosaminyltransferase